MQLWTAVTRVRTSAGREWFGGPRFGGQRFGGTSWLLQLGAAAASRGRAVRARARRVRWRARNEAARMRARDRPLESHRVELGCRRASVPAWVDQRTVAASTLVRDRVLLVFTVPSAFGMAGWTDGRVCCHRRRISKSQGPVRAAVRVRVRWQQTSGFDRQLW